MRAYITERERLAVDKVMAKFSLKRGVKYDVKATDVVIVITPAELQSKEQVNE